MSKGRSNWENGTYKIGKGRPPKATQWKPGQSGNLRGRRKGSKNLATIFYEGLNQKIQIQEGGRIRKITVREGIVRRLLNQALKGDIKATAFVLAKEPEVTKQERRRITSDMNPKEASAIYEAFLKDGQQR